jgi:stage II sporulation protein D
LSPRRAAAAAAVGLALVASCIRQEAPQAVPGPAPAAPAGPEPEVRVALQVGATSLMVGGGAPLTVTQPDGTPIARLAPGESWRVVIAGQGLALVSPTGRTTDRADALAIIPEDPGDVVRAGRRDYHGTFDVLRDRTGLTLINRVGLEAYVGGVVGGEMGRRDPSEIEALRAQAVASRTYALRNMGRWRTAGFDF